MKNATKITAVGAALFSASIAHAMPRPPVDRGEAETAGGATQVKVRRIEQIKPISTTAPAPRAALAGKHRLIVVLVETADAKFTSDDPVAEQRARFFETDKPSVSHYYKAVSYGLYNLEGVVIGPLKVPGSLRSYAYGKGGNSARVHKLVKHAFAAAAQATDLKSFDTHNQFGQRGRDGIIDHFAVVFPGQGDPFKPIWPHRGTVGVKVKGWRLGSYFVVSTDAPLGTLVHEYGHDIGLPDLYDRDDSSHGAGAWTTMAAGGWLAKGAVPSHLSAWGKIKMGWIRPTLMTEPRARVEIPASDRAPFAIKIPVGRIDSPEYFLIENRQRGNYDAALPDHGLLVWHINEGAKNNDNEAIKMIDVEEPGSEQDLDVLNRGVRPDGRDTFRAGRQRTFSDQTIPDATTYGGKRSGIAINNISTSSGLMRADFDVPKIRNPGGEPHKIVYDNYTYGQFSNLGFGAGAERLVRFQSTEGAFELHSFEALFMGTPRSRGDVTFRVYSGTNDKPKKVVFEKRAAVEFGDDSYQWVTLRTGRPAGVRLGDKQTFWVGVEHHEAATGLVMNPIGFSKRSYFRKGRNQAVTNVYNRDKQLPDFILRVGGYGYIGKSGAPASQEATADDGLVKEMRLVDALLDKKDWQGATAKYEVVLTKMEQKPDQYATWIPVVHNSLGVAAYQAKDYNKAIDYFQRSLKRAQLANDAEAEADILHNIGETSFHSGDLTQAASYCERSAALNGGRPARLLENKFWLGRVRWAQERKDEATPLFDEAARLAEELYAKKTEDLDRWKKRIAKARNGGKDPQAESRLLKERQKERELEEGKVEEERDEIWKIDFSEFGIELGN